MYLFIQEDFSFEIRLEVLHFILHLLLDHCIEGDAQLIQPGLQGRQVRSLLQTTGKVRANQQSFSYWQNEDGSKCGGTKATKREEQLRLV